MNITSIISKGATTALKTVQKYSPEILVGVGIVGVVSTAVLAVRATPKAMSDIDQARREKKNSLPDDLPAEAYQLTTAEIVKASWKNYIPATISGACSIASIIGARNLEVRKISALGAAYQATALALEDKSKYAHKLEESLSNKKVETIKQECAQERIDAAKATMNPNLPAMKKDDEIIILDDNTGQFFISTKNKVEAVFNRFNARLSREMFMTHNDLLDDLGERVTNTAEFLGYTTDEYPVEPEWYHEWLDEEKGITCSLLKYQPALREV